MAVKTRALREERLKRIRQQAIDLASKHRQVAPAIQQVFWFPSDKEVRLIEVEESAFPEPDKRITPFYFPPVPDEGISEYTALAIIRPDECKRLLPPSRWGSWADAQEL